MNKDKNDAMEEHNDIEWVELMKHWLTVDVGKNKKNKTFLKCRNGRQKTKYKILGTHGAISFHYVQIYNTFDYFMAK